VLVGRDHPSVKDLTIIQKLVCTEGPQPSVGSEDLLLFFLDPG
jgi:hypothetical protein